MLRVVSDSGLIDGTPLAFFEATKSWNKLDPISMTDLQRGSWEFP